MPRSVCLLPLALIAAVSVASAQNLLPNGGFEEGLTGWEAVARDGATPALSADKPAAGKSCLLLPTTGKQPALVLSPTSEGLTVGDLAVVSFSARRGAGQSTLALDILGTAGDFSEAVIWEAALPVDANWHKVSLLLKVPPVLGEGKPRLAFSALGAAGSWSLDEVSVTRGTLPAAAPLALPGGPAETGRLAADWKPDGLLDAQTHQVGQEQELYVVVNGIMVTARPTVPCYRGFREGMVMYAVNRGKPDKELRVAVHAPLSVESPSWTVPIKGDGTTRFHIAVQCMRQGEHNLKLAVASGADQAALPVKMVSKRCYPALGVLWDGALSAAEAQPLQDSVLGTYLVIGPPDYAAFGPLAEPLRALGADLLGAPLAGRLDSTQFAAALGQLGAEMDPSFWVPFVERGADPGPATTAAVTAAVVQRRKVRNAGVFSPPLDLRRAWPAGNLLPARPDLLSADKTAGLMAVTVRPPRLGAPCVIGEQVDGQADAVSGALMAQTRQADLTALRNLLSERQVNLPLLVIDLQARPSGDERLEALHLARALTLALYQGSTGVMLQPRRDPANAFGLLPLTAMDGQPHPLAQALREVAQELMGATPVAALAATEAVSTSPQATIGFRPFMRGGEGILVMWNNTGISRDVTLEFRSQPVVGQYVRLSYQGEFVQRRWDPIFRFGDEAFARQKPVLTLRLNPLDVCLASFRLLDPHAAWLRAIDLAKPFTPVKDTMPPGREERTWWRDMLKGQVEEIKPQ